MVEISVFIIRIEDEDCVIDMLLFCIGEGRWFLIEWILDCILFSVFIGFMLLLKVSVMMLCFVEVDEIV